MALLVLKFGGTSVADIDRIRNVAAHVKREADAGPVDRRTDLFSVGALLYTMIRGEPPPQITRCL